MSSPRDFEGGPEPFIQDLMPDVIVGLELVSRTVAYNASRTALRYVSGATQLPFIGDHIDYPDGSSITDVRLHEPTTTEPSTALGDLPLETVRARSFLTVVDALASFSGVRVDDVEWAHIMVDGYNKLGSHQDLYDGSRATLQLRGSRFIEFTHTPVQASTRLWLFETDAYKMDFRTDERSIWHGVDYFEDPCVAVYINT